MVKDAAFKIQKIFCNLRLVEELRLIGITCGPNKLSDNVLLHELQ